MGGLAVCINGKESQTVFISNYDNVIIYELSYGIDNY